MHLLPPVSMWALESVFIHIVDGSVCVSVCVCRVTGLESMV